ncbi:MAG: DUF4176 domain-containing protein [Eubacteriales bacterium]|nr:DUF4176 domain-containing protein [Lachnospiraceae bacterium]MDO5127326.1 DUF4176 domain-containing protein [Eubacteriales bacterium]
MKTLLPLGTVVSIKGVDHRVMVLGYARFKEGDTSHVYDYIGCYFPEGFVGGDKTMIFDHSMIESLYYLGYNNEESAQFITKVADTIEKVENQSAQAAAVTGAQ